MSEEGGIDLMARNEARKVESELPGAVDQTKLVTDGKAVFASVLCV